MNRSTLKLLLPLLAAIALQLLPACNAGGKGGAERLTPSDFAGARSASPEAAPAAQPAEPAVEASAPVTPEAEPAAAAAASEAAPAPAPVRTADATAAPAAPTQPLTVDAMVGQVNGRAVYASQILDPIGSQLQQLGRNVPPGEFRRRARELIAGTLEQIVYDSLILGEAERDLSEQERYGLRYMLKLEREKLVNVQGYGSEAIAENRLREESNRGVAEAMTEKRTELLIKRYLQQKLIPRINVTKKDIRRYYMNHYADFNPATTRTLQLVVTRDDATAQQIEQRLAAGTPFAEVGHDLQGVSTMNLPDIQGEKVFGNELDEALVELDAGEHTGRIDINGSAHWVRVEKLERTGGKSLREAQTEIEQILRTQQYQQHHQLHRRELLRRGSFGSLQAMTDALLEVAEARYLPRT